ncbi:hypothetical protein J7T55_013438 [Diaporthe amygdali]|uniref:uncharacterized protein n=1 Tax=Phomopsis amygdali TaxID=1214568 RepID=UPI0022FEA43D|nr:uncharacterized protein J7T55_013438 [Diaporthe amygdali]KAJ0119201.1 hypothetical protein J7T55_013438 [Diaporthe amygdali]
MVRTVIEPTAKQPIGWPGTYPESAASFPLAKSSRPIDDEDDWEFEYSTTETETYYLTMDLSHPGMFEKVKDTFHSQNRGGYRQWFNPVYADPNKNTRFRPTKTNAILLADEEDKDDEDLVPREDEEADVENDNTRGDNTIEANGNETVDENGGDGDKDMIDPRLRGASQPAAVRMSPKPTEEATEMVQPQASKKLKSVGEIQVLDLHSDSPVVSYKGRIFSGSWASNIGTELIFGAHDEVADRGLPYLRSLSGDVDLMAASSARILTTPADLKPKNPTTTAAPQRRQAPDRYRKLRKESGIEIPVAFDKHGFRKPQARFLENIMAIKRKRGEMDEVTTMTRDTTRYFVDAEDDPEEAQLQKKRARDRRRQLRLMEERAARPKTRKKRGNRWATREQVVRFGEKDPETEGEDEVGEASTRTPGAWDDLEGVGGDGVEEVDEDSEAED